MITSIPIRRNIYAQTGTFGFETQLSVDSLTGTLNFGFSGIISKINFALRSGRIIDHTGYYIGTYKANDSLSLSGTISPSGIDYYLNSNLIGVNVPRTPGSITYFYLKPSGCVADCDIFVYGKTPSYSLTNYVSYSANNPNIALTITNNSSRSFKIFSGDFSGDNSRFVLSGLPTGDILGAHNFYFVQNNITGYNILNYNLYTSFGTLNLSAAVSGYSNAVSTYNLQVFGPNTVDTTTTSYYSCVFSSNDNPISVQASLNYLSGSGVSYANIPASGQYSAVVGSNITGSGYLSKTIDIPISGMSNGVIYTGNIQSGVSGYQYATGNQTFNYLFTATGTGISNTYTGLATGLISGQITGVINSGSGYYNYKDIIYNNPSTCAYNTYINATGSISYNNPADSDVLYIGDKSIGIVQGYQYSTISGLSDYLNSNLFTHHVSAQVLDSNTIQLTSAYSGISGNYLPLILGSGNIGSMQLSSTGLIGGGQQSYDLTPTGFFSGILQQTFTGIGYYTQYLNGILKTSISAPSVQKTFTGVWNMQTGFDLNNLTNVNYNQASYYTNAFTDVYNTFYVALTYSNSTSKPDTAILTLTGIGLQTGFSLLISGTP